MTMRMHNCGILFLQKVVMCMCTYQKPNGEEGRNWKAEFLSSEVVADLLTCLVCSGDWEWKKSHEGAVRKLKRQKQFIFFARRVPHPECNNSTDSMVQRNLRRGDLV